MYTEDDFRTALHYPEARHDKKLISDALRIAVNVMQPGVIEDAMMGNALTRAESIRKALIGEPHNDQWEYKIEGLPLHPNNFNAYGREGWELVTALDEHAAPLMPGNVKGNRLFIFKRRLR